MVKAAAETPQQFAGGTADVEQQQHQADKEGKHPAEVKGALAREDKSAEAGAAGPALQLLDFDIAAGIWRGSVLYLTKQAGQLAGRQPLLHLQTLVGISCPNSESALMRSAAACHWAWQHESCQTMAEPCYLPFL